MQADIHLRCTHMAKDRFSHEEAHILNATFFFEDMQRSNLITFIRQMFIRKSNDFEMILLP